MKDKKVNFVFVEDENFIPSIEKATSVAVVPFTEDGKIIATDLSDRGIDIPGGHRLDSEKKFEETARREVMEEIAVEMGKLKLCQVIQSDYYGSEAENLTYMVIMTGFVKRFHEFELREEEKSQGRIILNLEDFVARYHAGDNNSMKKVVFKAYDIVFNN